jgi:MarR family transcriptional regulator, organic hydroperoxide resistance regulator
VSEYDQLKLDNQLCFPLYAVSRLVTKMYQPLLKELDLTYPQYLIMLVLWEEDNLLVTNIGKKLILETNTLTPLLKRLEVKGLISRNRSNTDERKVIITLSDTGKIMKENACQIPIELTKTFSNKFSLSKSIELKNNLQLLLDILKDS